MEGKGYSWFMLVCGLVLVCGSMLVVVQMRTRHRLGYFESAESATALCK